MDVFKIEQSMGGSLGGSLTTGDASHQVTTEVTFDTTSDFNLSFFDASTPPTPRSPPGSSYDAHDVIFTTPQPPADDIIKQENADLNHLNKRNGRHQQQQASAMHMNIPVTLFHPPAQGQIKVNPPPTPPTTPGVVSIKTGQLIPFIITVKKPRLLGCEAPPPHHLTCNTWLRMNSQRGWAGGWGLRIFFWFTGSLENCCRKYIKSKT